MLRRMLGQRGERRAESFLRGKGLKTVTRNWHCRHGEIDLVMVDDDELVFVEVRSRTPGRFGDGVDTVDRSKRGKLIRAADSYLARHGRWRDVPCRFDVIGIDRAGETIDWIRHAFEVE